MNTAAGLPAFEAHQSLPVLYSFRRCPYAMRARLAIAASGLHCELREVALRSKPADLLAASPKATVPVLVLPGGGVIEQSLEIMHWALAQNDPQGWLAADRLPAMQALIAVNDGEFKQHLDRYKYPNRYRHEYAGDEQAFAQAHRTDAGIWLMQLESQLSGNGFGRHPWLFGNAASLADMAILPFFRQFAHTEAVWFDAQPWPLLKAWLVGWETGLLFRQVMEKYPPWQAGEPGIAFGPWQTGQLS